MMSSKAIFSFMMLFLVNSTTSFGQKKSFQTRGKALDKAFIAQDLKTMQRLSTVDAIFMLEYQRTLRGFEHIQQYYLALFAQQQIKSIQRTLIETIALDDYLIEIGTFIKVFSRTSDHAELTHEGKYWRVWKKVNDELLLFNHVEGYHRELPRDEYVVVDVGIEPKNIGNLELRAYSALDEKAIREWDAELRIAMYTSDAVFYPFADSAQRGIETLKPYLRNYHRHDIDIKRIIGKPFAYYYFENYVLQYATFEVDWRFEASSGTNKGKGIKLWQRQPDHSLKIYRQIGLHNELNP